MEQKSTVDDHLAQDCWIHLISDKYDTILNQQSITDLLKLRESTYGDVVFAYSFRWLDDG